MCDPTSLLAVASYAASASGKFTAKPPKAPEPPKVLTPAPTAKRASDASGGYGSTLLTSPSGIAAGAQNIGSNTLLGQ